MSASCGDRRLGRRIRRHVRGGRGGTVLFAVRQFDSLHDAPCAASTLLREAPGSRPVFPWPADASTGLPVRRPVREFLRAAWANLAVFQIGLERLTAHGRALPRNHFPRARRAWGLAGSMARVRSNQGAASAGRSSFWRRRAALSWALASPGRALATRS